MLDLGKYGGIAEMMADVDDLEKLSRALVREMSIRSVMAETGEDRETVLSVVQAGESMQEEAVLELMEGAPTTLAEALSRYIGELEKGDAGPWSETVAGDLGAILNYPWRDEEAVVHLHDANRSLALEVREAGGNRDLEILLGDRVIYEVNWEDVGSAGTRAAEEVARAMHRSVLARVIADRPHHVQLSSTGRRSLMAWLERPNGSWSIDDQGRVSMDAVEGGGVLVRTRPFWASQQFRQR